MSAVPSDRTTSRVALVAHSADRLGSTRQRCRSAFPLIPVDLSRVGPEDLVDRCRGTQAVLVEWGLRSRRVLEELVRRLPRDTGTPPLIALCREADQHAPALFAGADFVLPPPVRPTQVQACRAAFTRRRASPSGAGPAGPDEATQWLGEGAGPDPVSTVDERGDGRAEQAPVLEQTPLRTGPLTLDAHAQEIRADGHRLSLSSRPFALLAYLMQHAGACCEREQLLDDVWNLDFDPSTNLVSVQICEIRAALEPHGYRDLVQTVRGRGYRLRTPDG